MDAYHSLIRAHGIIAAITFLGLVPVAIILARFYRRSSFWAMRLHIWTQIMVLILTTVLFILGFFAVGPERNLTNPHHSIGVAIYVLVIVQVLGGCLVHRRAKAKRPTKIPVKLILHHWLGRTIALLGVVQIALGLTLYGSPKELFIVYALGVFGLLVTYFVLSVRHQRRQHYDFDGTSSYFSGEDSGLDGSMNHRKSKLGKLAAGGLGAAGLAALMKGRSSQHRRENSDMGTNSATSYLTDEKYSDTSNKGWKDKLLTVGAVAGGIAAVKALFGGRPEKSSDMRPYRPPLGGNTSVTTDSYLEQGGRPARPVTPPGASPGHARPSHPLAQPPMTPHHHHSNSSLTYSYTSGSPSRQDRRHTFRNAAATGGTLFAVRQLFKRRGQRKENRHYGDTPPHKVKQDPFTGEGFSPVPDRSPNRIPSRASSDFSSSLAPSDARRPSGRRPHRHSYTGPSSDVVGAGVGAPGLIGATAAATVGDRDHPRPASTGHYTEAGPSTTSEMEQPPVPPEHRPDADYSSPSDNHTNASGPPHHRHHRHQRQHHNQTDGPSTGRPSSPRRRSSRTQNTDSMESPPVSLKVKMHNDGRHVTLRRLTEEEASRQRRANRRAKRATVPNGSADSDSAAGLENNRRRRRRNSSFSSASGAEGPPKGRRSSAAAVADRQWRRTEALERRQAEEAAAVSPSPADAQPPPPLQPSQATPSQSYPPLPQQLYYPPPTQSQHPPPFHPQAPPMVDPRTGQPPNNYTDYPNYPPPPPIPSSNTPGPNANASAPSGIGSITSPGTEATASTEYANNRRRRRAERAQARQAREARWGGGGGGDGRGGNVEFT